MIPHGFAKDEAHAAELAMNAGVDMDMQSGAYKLHLANLVKSGRVDERDITQAARRILEMKYRLGLFDDPYRFCNEEREKELVKSSEHMEIARDISRKSLVLLKNKR